MTKDLAKGHEVAKAKIEEFLSHYEDGMDLLKKPASKAGEWRYPARIKEEFKDKPGLPTDWVGVVAQVQEFIAVEKYDLDFYNNSIELINDQQMLDNYSSIGMPASYDHWSFGMQNAMEREKLEKGQMGLAFEIVINSDPSLVYCMDTNTPLMQILVIAHAAYGHNSFFKGNYMFKDNTQAEHIIEDLEIMRDYIRDCEKKYGIERVERLLDACHALETHSVSRTKARKATSEQNRETVEGESADKPSSIKSIANRTFKSVKDSYALQVDKEDNLLEFFADHAPHLEDWQRNIMDMIANKAQYFYPQRQTQVMNEGWASYWHYTILHDMQDMGLLSDAQMLEFYASHAGVVKQPEYDETVTVPGPDGQPKEIPIYNGINPYALGISIFEDIKRICMEPTEEDREWFPDIAGNQDWLGTFKNVMEDYRDETFIHKYMSPKVMRDFRLFAVVDDDREETIEVAGIHNDKGFKTVRQLLAAQYRLSERDPNIHVSEYHHRTDRRLILQHQQFHNKPVEERDMQDVLKYMYQIWGHPIVLESLDSDGKVADVITCPPDLDLREPEPPTHII